MATIEQNNLKKQLPSLGTSKVTWGPWCCFITKLGWSSGKSSTFRKKENLEHCWRRHSLVTWVTDFSQLSLAPSTAYTAIHSSSLKGRKSKVSFSENTHYQQKKDLILEPFTTCLERCSGDGRFNLARSLCRWRFRDWFCVKSQNSLFALFFHTSGAANARSNENKGY